MESDQQVIIENSELEAAIDAKKDMKRAGSFFLLVMLFEIPMAFLVHFAQSRFPEDSSVLVSIFMTQGYLLVCGIIYILLTRKSITRDFRLKPIRLSHFFLAILVLMLTTPMATVFNLISQFFAKNEASVAIYSVTEKVPVWLGVAIIGCLPGVIEELLYRGIMFHAFKKRTLLTGIVISGLSFGLMHMNFNQIMYAIYIGIIFALIVEVTDSLLTTMILHMLFNAANTLLLYIMPAFYSFMSKYNEAYSSLDMDAVMNESATPQQLTAMLIIVFPLAAIGLFLAILLMKYLAKQNGKELTWEKITECNEEVRSLKPITACLILGWIFCIVNAVAAL